MYTQVHHLFSAGLLFHTCNDPTKYDPLRLIHLNVRVENRAKVAAIVAQPSTTATRATCTVERSAVRIIKRGRTYPLMQYMELRKSRRTIATILLFDSLLYTTQCRECGFRTEPHDPNRLIFTESDVVSGITQ